MLTKPGFIILAMIIVSQCSLLAFRVNEQQNDHLDDFDILSIIIIILMLLYLVLLLVGRHYIYHPKENHQLLVNTQVACFFLVALITVFSLESLLIQTDDDLILEQQLTIIVFWIFKTVDESNSTVKMTLNWFKSIGILTLVYCFTRYQIHEGLNMRIFFYEISVVLIFLVEGFKNTNFCFCNSQNKESQKTENEIVIEIEQQNQLEVDNLSLQHFDEKIGMIHKPIESKNCLDCANNSPQELIDMLQTKVLIINSNLEIVYFNQSSEDLNLDENILEKFSFQQQNHSHQGEVDQQYSINLTRSHNINNIYEQLDESMFQMTEILQQESPISMHYGQVSRVDFDLQCFIQNYFEILGVKLFQKNGQSFDENGREEIQENNNSNYGNNSNNNIKNENGNQYEDQDSPLQSGQGIFSGDLYAREGFYEAQPKNRLRCSLYFNENQYEMSLKGIKLKDEVHILIELKPQWTKYQENQVKIQMKDKIQLFGSLTHQFRTPLNCSISLLEVLQCNLQSNMPELIDQFLSPALNSNKLLLNYINDMLDLVQMDEGQFQFTWMQFNLQNLLQDCLIMIGMSAQIQKIDLYLNYDKFLPSLIISDPNRLRQVILNFLSNSLQFTQCGTLKVNVQPIYFPANNSKERGDPLQLGPNKQSIFKMQKEMSDEEKYLIRNDSDMKIKFLQGSQAIDRIEDEVEQGIINDSQIALQISVVDTGIGISEANQQKIFSAFNKIDLGSNSDMNAQGCGLGLLISQSIAKGLNPTYNLGIDVKSEVGKGSSFSFIIEDHDSISFQEKLNFQRYADGSVNEESPNLTHKMKGIKKRRNKDSFSSHINLSSHYETRNLSQVFQEDMKSQNESVRVQPSRGSLFSIKSQDQISQYTPTMSEGGGEISHDSVPSSGQRRRVDSNANYNQRTTAYYGYISRLDSPNFDDYYNQGASDEIKHLSVDLQTNECDIHAQIMIVDDNAFNTYALSSMFESFEIKTNEAHNFQQALDFVTDKIQCKHCSQKNFQIIFMDIDMPEKDGYETTQLIRNLYEKEHVCEKVIIIACTGFVGEQDVNKSKISGMDDFVSKPLGIDGLQRILENWGYKI